MLATCLCPVTLRNLRDMDRTSGFYNTCYAIIYKRILNAYIDVCICDELGYFLMYILLYQSHYEFIRIVLTTAQ